jgi:hypothetical protein
VTKMPTKPHYYLAWVNLAPEDEESAWYIKNVVYPTEKMHPGDVNLTKKQTESFLFPSAKQCELGVYIARQLFDVHDHGYMILTESRTLYIAQSKLRIKARELFGLKANCPRVIAADAFEDAGMQNEATILRATRRLPDGATL